MAIRKYYVSVAINLLTINELQFYKSIKHIHIHRQTKYSQDEYAEDLNKLKLYTNTIERFLRLVKKVYTE